MCNLDSGCEKLDKQTPTKPIPETEIARVLDVMLQIEILVALNVFSASDSLPLKRGKTKWATFAHAARCQNGGCAAARNFLMKIFGVAVAAIRAVATGMRQGKPR